MHDKPSRFQPSDFCTGSTISHCDETDGMRVDLWVLFVCKQSRPHLVLIPLDGRWKQPKWPHASAQSKDWKEHSLRTRLRRDGLGWKEWRRRYPLQHSMLWLYYWEHSSYVRDRVHCLLIWKIGFKGFRRVPQGLNLRVGYDATINPSTNYIREKGTDKRFNLSDGKRLIRQRQYQRTYNQTKNEGKQ